MALPHQQPQTVIDTDVRCGDVPTGRDMNQHVMLGWRPDMMEPDTAPDRHVGGVADGTDVVERVIVQPRHWQVPNATDRVIDHLAGRYVIHRQFAAFPAVLRQLHRDPATVRTGFPPVEHSVSGGIDDNRIEQYTGRTILDHDKLRMVGAGRSMRGE